MSRAIAFIAGLGTGMMDQSRRQEAKDRQDKIDKITFDKADRETRQADREDRKQREIETANTDTTVTPGAAVTGLSTDGNAAQYTDADVAASDLRQSRTMAEQTGTEAPKVSVAQKFAAGGINYDTQGQADTAAKAFNDPNAKVQRTVSVLSKYDPVAAQKLRMESNQANAEEQKAADIKWNRDLMGAMGAGHEGLAAMVTNSNGGPMAGVQLKAVPSADGQTVTYAKVAPDGTLTPTKLTFPNTQEGVMQAAYMLDKTVTPAQRLEHALKVNKDEREGRESEAKAGYYDALAGKNNALAANGGSAAGKKADHFDEKQWDAASKIDKSVVSLPNAMGDKDVESGDLRSAYLQVFNAAKAGGQMAPNEAVEHATTTIVKLKNAASARVEQALAADPKSKLTVNQAVRDILKEAQAAQKKAPPAAAPASAPASPGSAKQGQIDILNQEMRKAQATLSQPNLDPEARVRAQADIQSLTNELGRLGVKSAPPAAAAAAGGIPAPAPVPAPAPAAAVAAQGVQPGPGADLDAARMAYTTAVTRLNSYGLKQRAADPQGYAQAQAQVAAAQQARQKAEAAYAQSVGTVRPAFAAARP